MKLTSFIRGGAVITTGMALGGILLAQEGEKQGYPLPGVKPMEPPKIDPAAKMVEVLPKDDFRKLFLPGFHIPETFSLEDQIETYRKAPVSTARPMLNLGREMYAEGPLRDYPNLLGDLNPTTPHFMIYGDSRTAAGYSKNQDNEVARLATRLNVDLDVQITATERIHAFAQPFDDNGKVMSTEFGGADDGDSDFQLDGHLNTLFFEGDAGPIVQGLTGKRNDKDMPFAVGLIPLLFQNGVWLEDAFYGAAFTIPAMNSPKFQISNMDVTFFAGGDDVSSGALKSQGTINHEGGTKLVGVTSFIETHSGYAEVGYGLAVNTGGGDSADVNSLTAAWTHRYWNFLTNSLRVLVNFGEQTDPGALFLAENSFRTPQPYTLLPYFNMFVGLGQPESLARDAGAGGVLKNTGINFEADALTLFPKLDDTGHNRLGAALGVEYLPNLFTAPHRQQIVLELAALHSYDDNAPVDRGDEIGLGARYQIVVATAWIFRADAMVASVENGDDLSGFRVEIRKKW